MIEPNELRIGNFLCDAKERFCIVEKIELRKKDYEEDQLFRAPAFKGGITSLPNKPIIITESWLVDLGFEDQGDEHTSRWCHVDEDLFGFEENVLDMSNGQWAHFWDGSFTNSPCRYVHQLQNLFFALTGKELKLQNGN